MRCVSGAGVGLRSEHFEVFLSEHPPTVPWLEILADNYLGSVSISFEKVKLISQRYPVVLHCVNCGVGNSDPINWEYCKQIKAMSNVLKPAWISDHLCWTALDGQHTHALLPLPFTKVFAQQIGERIARLQDYFELPFLIENVAAYLRTPYDTLSEVDFLNRVADIANCGILLDVANLYVNMRNHNECADTFLQAVNADRVKQYHLAGHEIDGNYCIDTHDRTINESVWSLYVRTLNVVGVRPTCIEWDAKIPVWQVLSEEIKKIDGIMQQ